MADYTYITATGQIIPDTSTLLTDVQSEYKTAFGGDLIVTANTPQGILITGETLARSSVLAINSQVGNQINPNFSGGIFLDAILALMGSQRVQSTFTTVVCQLTGVPGTIISSGSLAQNSSTQEQFELTTTVTLDVSGNGTGTFEAIDPGEITADPGTITIIVSGVIGWETVNNALSASSIGSLTQSDTAAKNYRLVTLAGYSTSLPEAVITGLFKVANVIGVAFRINDEPTTQVIDGITMSPKSMYACVDGGLDTDIANTLVAKKSGGCAYNGSTSVVVTTPLSGQVMTVKFDRPTLVPVLVKVTITADAAIADPEGAVTQAILDYAAGKLALEPGFTLGVPVSCFELAGAINQEYPSIFVHNVQTSLYSTIDYSNAEIPIGINEKATVNAGGITVILS